MELRTMTQDVFISYAMEDKRFADIACTSLESEGIACWIAPRDGLPGRPWGESIIKAINESKVMVVIFSSNANKSPYIRREVNHAVETGLTVITVRVEDVQPSGALQLYLDADHWLDAIDPPLQKQLPRLNDNVRELLKLPRRPAVSVPVSHSHGIPKWSVWLGAGLVAIVLMIFVLSVIKGKDDKGGNVNHTEPTASPTRSSDSSSPRNITANGNSTIVVPSSPAAISTSAPTDDTSSRINEQAKVLGDPNANTAQQVNAIYALEPLAAKSLEYQKQVVNILATHIRTYAKWQGGTNRADKPAPDNIQAAITVLGGRKWTYGKDGETQPLDFSGLDLRGVVFRIEGKRANFDGARLRGAHLNEAILMQTNFRFAILAGAIMKGADVNQADFCGADLSQVDARESEMALAWNRNKKCEP
jgi:TIR domain/Pentapeptide repeats (8 copies)